ncbi:putative transcription factor interactor and regulator CCHC(Zn) family [Helianthus annuus]|nr:putative transcription factor interactor and regulator CCHC(Zn) family [Helianthus annuus]
MYIYGITGNPFRYQDIFPPIQKVSILYSLSFILSYSTHLLIMPASYVFNSVANPNTYANDTDVSGLQQSGIRATSRIPVEIRTSSSTLPCQHCEDEQLEGVKHKRKVKLCFYCHRPGHLIYSCKSKENDEATQLVNQAINAGIQTQRMDAGDRGEMIVTGTDAGQWNDIWYVSYSFSHHYAGNINVFKRIKHLIGVDTKTGENDFLFIRGIGNVDIKSNNETVRIQSVLYTPELNRNVLSMNQLTLQGFTVKKSGDTCRIFPMFCPPVLNTFSDVTGMTKEEEMGEKERQKVLNLNDMNEKYKQDYLNSYFEDLNVSKEQEFDWSRMITRALEFKEFSDCQALLDMIDDRDFVFKYKHDLEVKFETMVGWFLKEKMEITTRMIPPQLDDGRKINLLDLYVMVEKDGGYQSVTLDNLWPAIAKDLGFEYQDGDFIRIIYAMYLDVLVFYYKFKSVQKKAQDKEMLEQEGTPMAANERTRRSKSAEAESSRKNEETEHYALFTRNSLDGSWILHKKRRRFNFSEARKAIDEANKSVMMQR